MLQLIEISLICTGIHVSFMEGMIFSKIRLDLILDIFRHTYNDYSKIDKIVEIITKPLYDCLPCMASVWTILIMREIDIKSIVIVCGMNAIIASVLQFFANSKLPE